MSDLPPAAAGCLAADLYLAAEGCLAADLYLAAEGSPVSDLPPAAAGCLAADLYLAAEGSPVSDLPPAAAGCLADQVPPVFLPVQQEASLRSEDLQPVVTYQEREAPVAPEGKFESVHAVFPSVYIRQRLEIQPDLDLPLCSLLFR